MRARDYEACDRSVEMTAADLISLTLALSHGERGLTV